MKAHTGIPQGAQLHILIRRETAPDVNIKLPVGVWPRIQEVMPDTCRQVILNNYGDFDNFRSRAEDFQPSPDKPFSFNQGSNTISIWFSDN